MASRVPKIKLTSVRAKVRSLASRSVENLLQGAASADERVQVMETASLLRELATRWRRERILVPALTASRIALDLGVPPLRETLRGLPAGEAADPGDLRRCAVVTMRVLSSSFALDGSPPVGDTPDADLTMGIVAWLVREMPRLDAIGEMDAASAGRVLEALELDFEFWIPRRVERLVKDYERSSYGNKKKKKKK